MRSANPHPWHTIFHTALLFLLLAPPPAQDLLHERQAHFANEADPVRKAKALAKLGDLEFELLRNRATRGEYEEALRILAEYRDSVKTAHAALKSTGRNAERKPEGYKQLEMHLRKSIRLLDETILELPYDERGKFEDIRHELDGIDQQLIDELFPRQPGRQKDNKPPRS